jgi:hypothetical protein
MKKKFVVLKNGRARANGWLAVSGAVFTVIGIGANNAQAHGFEGDYFFPPTIATDDPFATDELLLPAVSHFRSPAADGSPATGTTDIGFELIRKSFPNSLSASREIIFTKNSTANRWSAVGMTSP